MQDFKKLQIYEEAKQFAIAIYKVTSNFPKEETFGITSQLRRASTSIGANIAEGSGRRTNPDFLRFLHNSMGSLKEIDYFLSISKELRYIGEEDYLNLNESLDKLARKLNLFMRRLG